MKLRSFSPVGDQVAEGCSELAAYLLHDGHHHYANSELAIITLEAPLQNSRSMTSSATIWEELHQAWKQIGQSTSKGDLAAWRLIYRYGDEIAPGLRVFRLRESKSPKFFYLVSQKEPLAAAARLNDVLFSLSTRVHIDEGRCVFHAAGIVYKDYAHIFVGPSGAGKSTVSSLSDALGHRIIHGDHVVLYPDQVGDYLVTDISPSIPGIPLKSIFFLFQDSMDRLIPLSALETTRLLFNGFLDIVSDYTLSEKMLRYAFTFCADIARRTPGYKLHFRKSPDFWKLINELFPD
jgi:hypothetical protein